MSIVFIFNKVKNWQVAPPSQNFKKKCKFPLWPDARYIDLLGMFLSLISGSELDLQYLRNYPEIPYQIGRKAGCVMYFCKLRQADYLEISG